MGTHTYKSKLWGALLAISFIFVVLVCHTAYWLHSTIYDTGHFTTIATAAITTETSRESIATAVVDKTFADRPVARKVVGTRLSTLIAGLLGTDLAQTAVENIVEQGHLLITAAHPESITFDTTTLKQQIVALQTAVNGDRNTTRFDTSQIPDEVVILDASKLPNVYRYGIAALWMGAISLLTLLAGTALYIYRGMEFQTRVTRLRKVLALLALSSVIALMVGPLTRPVFLTFAANAPSQTLLRNVFDGFIAPFNAQATSVVVVALLLLTTSLFFESDVSKSLIGSLRHKSAEQIKSPKQRKART